MLHVSGRAFRCTLMFSNNCNKPPNLPPAIAGEGKIADAGSVDSGSVDEPLPPLAMALKSSRSPRSSSLSRRPNAIWTRLKATHTHGSSSPLPLR